VTIEPGLPATNPSESPVQECPRNQQELETVAQERQGEQEPSGLMVVSHLPPVESIQLGQVGVYQGNSITELTRQDHGHGEWL
jgi:hypothetical protein